MHLLASCALATLIGAASIISTASAQLLDRKDLSFATALTVATGALEACKARGYATSVVVVDRGGNTVVALRGRRRRTLRFTRRGRGMRQCRNGKGEPISAIRGGKVILLNAVQLH
jgi:hypothetical protein